MSDDDSHDERELRHGDEPPDVLPVDDEREPPGAYDPAHSGAPGAADSLGWPELPKAVCAEAPDHLAEERRPLALSPRQLPCGVAPVAVAVVLAALLAGCLRACAAGHTAPVARSPGRSSSVAVGAAQETARLDLGSNGDSGLAGRSRRRRSGANGGGPRVKAARVRARSLVSPTAVAIARSSLRATASLGVEPVPAARRSARLAVEPGLPEVRARVEFGFER